jgi:hypothetical protein
MDKKKLRKKAKDIKTGLPKTYVPKSLTPAQKKKQVKSIKEGKDRPILKGVKTRTSKYTLMAKKYFGDKRSIDDIAKKIKVPKKGLEEILEKGAKAYYTSGSRPNQNLFSWKTARLYSVLFGGKARTIDKTIVDKYKIPLLKI